MTGRWLRVTVALLLVAGLVTAAAHRPASGHREAAVAAGLGGDALLTLRDVATTSAPAPTTTTAPPPTTIPPPPPTTAVRRPPTTSAARKAATARVGDNAGIAPYRGLGTWSDVYDWSRSYTNNKPSTGPADVDRMASTGIQTLYIQASKHDSPTDVVDADLLQPILDRAHERGVRVVAWYLPTLVDTNRDLQRLIAVAALRNVDGLAVDIEARNVSDVNERNQRLIALSAALRKALPGRTIGAIALPPVVLEVINTSYWPSFPYRELAPSYDVWMTMGYWTNRKPESGYRDAYRYTKENVDRLRADVGRPDLPVHPIGGLGDGTTRGDVDGYRRATADVGGLGGSLYDWRTTRADCWPGMGAFRA